MSILVSPPPHIMRMYISGLGFKRPCVSARPQAFCLSKLRTALGQRILPRIRFEKVRTVWYCGITDLGY